jgi:hypothetical protein
VRKSFEYGTWGGEIRPEFSRMNWREAFAFNPAYCHFVILPSLELAGNSARDERSETHHRVQNRNPVGFASLDQPRSIDRNAF